MCVVRSPSSPFIEDDVSTFSQHPPLHPSPPLPHPRVSHHDASSLPVSIFSLYLTEKWAVDSSCCWPSSSLTAEHLQPLTHRPSPPASHTVSASLFLCLHHLILRGDLFITEPELILSPVLFVWSTSGSGCGFISGLYLMSVLLFAEMDPDLPHLFHIPTFSCWCLVKLDQKSPVDSHLSIIETHVASPGLVHSYSMCPHLPHFISGLYWFRMISFELSFSWIGSRFSLWVHLWPKRSSCVCPHWVILGLGLASTSEHGSMFTSFSRHGSTFGPDEEHIENIYLSFPNSWVTSSDVLFC